MTIRSGLVVLLKCFMILIGVELVIWLIGGTLGRNIPLPFIAMASLTLIPILLVYWFAESAVDVMTPKSDEVLPDTPIRLDGLQSVAFSAVGVFILYNAIRQTIYFILFLWQNQATGGLTPPPDIYVTPILSWVIGLYLLVGAPHLRRWLGGLRRAGQGAE